ncbi:MAG: hypothetical protein KGS60_17530 [Verrucomicrobia bacterium]|nr:hypothetical protein [Verrucomicrobiota bacterium]
MSGGSRKAEVEERIAAKVARKRSLGEPMVPLSGAPARGPLSATFWGKAWCERLEACSDYRDRLPSGRSRLRAGAVYDLAISEGEVFAYVAGEDLHEVLVRISPMTEERKGTLATACAGRIGSAVDLLTGNLGAEVMARLVDPDHGILPGADQIRFQCDCADHADLCGHGAAVLYAIGWCLDAEPALLFTLRGLDQASLVAGVAGAIGDLGGAGPEAWAHEDLNALFGIEMDEESG